MSWPSTSDDLRRDRRTRLHSRPCGTVMTPRTLTTQLTPVVVTFRIHSWANTQSPGTTDKTSNVLHNRMPIDEFLRLRSITKVVLNSDGSVNSRVVPPVTQRDIFAGSDVVRHSTSIRNLHSTSCGGLQLRHEPRIVTENISKLHHVFMNQCPRSVSTDSDNQRSPVGS